MKVHYQTIIRQEEDDEVKLSLFNEYGRFNTKYVKDEDEYENSIREIEAYRNLLRYKEWPENRDKFPSQ